MARTTFSGPVRSLNGFISTGNNMAQSIGGSTVDGGTDTLTLNGSTQGGLQGSYIQCRAADGLVWQIDTMLVGNGTFAQPWS